MNAANLLLIFTATFTALMAGLFFSWSFAVMPGLARLSDQEFVSAMQKMNRAILNPVFFAAFFGAPVFLIISTALHFGNDLRFWLLGAATAIYVVGTFGITAFGNVPLNNTLESFDLTSADALEISRQRVAFEKGWTNLNHLRTFSSIASVILIVTACLN